MDRPSRSPASKVQVPLPLSVPADRLAPVGTPDTVTKSTVSVLPGTAAAISRAIAVSSAPEAASTVTSAASPTGFTVTFSVSVTLSSSSPCFDSAVTVRLKSSLLSGGGVIERSPPNKPGGIVTEPSVTASSTGLPPGLVMVRTAPSGTPSMVRDKTSCGSFSEAVMSSAIAVSSSPTASCTINVGASASSSTLTLKDPVVSAVVVAPVSGSVSVEVTTTPNWKSVSSSSAGVIVRPERSPEVSVQLPSPLSVPADNVAPSGTPVISTDRTSPLSVRPAVMFNGISASSAPAASLTTRVGASASAATLTSKLPLVVAVVTSCVSGSVSVDVTTTPNWKSVASLAAGVTVRPVRSPGATVQLPLPLSVPADNVAPSGTPVISTDRTSPLSVRPAVMFNGISASSAPAASLTTRVGASASAATLTSKLPLVVAVVTSCVSGSVSVDVTTTPNWKSVASLAAGVTVRPVRSPGATVQLPLPLSVPADNVAPSGTPVISTDVISSEPSVSVTAAEMSNTIAVSSAPKTSETVTSGASATAATLTGRTAALLPPSVEVAVTVKSKSLLSFAAGVIVRSPRESRSSPVIVHVPLPLSVPTERVAPVGTFPITIEARSSFPGTSAEIPSEMASTPAESSSPAAPETVRFGSSSTAATLTGISAVLAPPSVDWTRTVRSNVPLKSAGGLISRPSS